MKKFLLALSLFLGTASFVSAQTKPMTTPAKTAKTSKTDKAEKTTKATGMNPMMRKDGTPDKRYKENKTTAPVEGPKKKDGTPDMRYKKNQTEKKTTTKP